MYIILGIFIYIHGCARRARMFVQNKVHYSLYLIYHKEKSYAHNHKERKVSSSEHSHMCIEVNKRTNLHHEDTQLILYYMLIIYIM